MHLYYSIGPDGKRRYTLKKVTDEGKTTVSAHPGSCQHQLRPMFLVPYTCIFCCIAAHFLLCFPILQLASRQTTSFLAIELP